MDQQPGGSAFPLYVEVSKLGRLQHIGPDGASSWETAKIYDITGGPGITPPPTCMFTYTDWSTCANGIRTRAVVSTSPAMCVGTPILQDTCTVTAPNVVVASLGSTTNSRSSFTQVVDWKGSIEYTFKGLTLTSNLNYKLIAGIKDSDNFGRGIMFKPDGSVIDNRLIAGDKILAPKNSIKLNTKIDSITFTLSHPLDATFFGAAPGTGSAFLGSFDSLGVKRLQ